MSLLPRSRGTVVGAPSGVPGAPRSMRLVDAAEAVIACASEKSACFERIMVVASLGWRLNDRGLVVEDRVDLADRDAAIRDDLLALDLVALQAHCRSRGVGRDSRGRR